MNLSEVQHKISMQKIDQNRLREMSEEYKIYSPIHQTIFVRFDPYV